MCSLPLFVSYAREDDFFQEAVDALLAKGIAQCMQKVNALKL